MRILSDQPFAKDSHLNPLWSKSRRQGQVGQDVARRIDADEPRDQAGDEKRPMSTQETISRDENRLAGEE
jgi:hypothetical protein